MYIFLLRQALVCDHIFLRAITRDESCDYNVSAVEENERERERKSERVSERTIARKRESAINMRVESESTAR